MRFLRGSAVVLGLVLCTSSIGSAQTADEQMRKDIQALKEGQQAIQQTMETIKMVLPWLLRVWEAVKAGVAWGLEKIDDFMYAITPDSWWKVRARVFGW